MSAKKARIPCGIEGCEEETTDTVMLRADTALGAVTKKVRVCRAHFRSVLTGSGTGTVSMSWAPKKGEGA